MKQRRNYKATQKPHVFFSNEIEINDDVTICKQEKQQQKTRERVAAQWHPCIQKACMLRTHPITPTHIPYCQHHTPKILKMLQNHPKSRILSKICELNDVRLLISKYQYLLK